MNPYEADETEALETLDLYLERLRQVRPAPLDTAFGRAAAGLRQEESKAETTN